MGRIIYSEEEEVNYANMRKEEIFKNNPDIASREDREEVYLLGQQFGDLVVEEFDGFVTINRVRESLWGCTCLNCGTKRVVMHEIQLLNGECLCCSP